MRLNRHLKFLKRTTKRLSLDCNIVFKWFCKVTGAETGFRGTKLIKTSTVAY